MKIVFYYGSIKNGGAERVITTLANFLIQSGDEVTIIVTDSGESGYYLNSEVRIIGLNNQHRSRNLTDAFYAFIKNIKNVRKHIKELKPDVVLAFDPQIAIVAKIACYGIQELSVIGSERSNPFMARKGWKSKIFVKMSTLLDGFVFQTEGAKSFYPAKTQNKSAVIPNGVFCGIPENIPAYERRPEWTICASGRIDKVKRYDLMVDAIEKLIKKYPDIVLDIYGEGNYKKDLETYIKNKGLQNTVILRGGTRSMAEQLVQHQVFLLTSDHEGMPNGLIEAMACGCACISTDCKFGPSELIQDGDNGLLVPVNDSRKVADAIELLFENSLKAGKIAENALMLRQTHSPKKIANMYRNYVTKIIGVE